MRRTNTEQGQGEILFHCLNDSEVEVEIRVEVCILHYFCEITKRPQVFRVRENGGIDIFL